MERPSRFWTFGSWGASSGAKTAAATMASTMTRPIMAVQSRHRSWPACAQYPRSRAWRPAGTGPIATPTESVIVASSEPLGDGVVREHLRVAARAGGRLVPVQARRVDRGEFRIHQGDP